MKKRILSSLIAVALGGCVEEPPPVSVSEFMENPRLLEAAVVRCAENRSQMKYEAECVNARDAVNRLEATQERQRREELERQSELKRQALRRTQEAAEAARQRALEEEKRRKEAEYLGLFETDGDVGSDQVPPTITEEKDPGAAATGAGTEPETDR
jgi:hypothetical protein